jgi:hypothetical protein
MSWARECTNPGGNNKQGWGGRIRMVMVNDEPVITYDQVFGGGDTIGTNVNLQQRTDAGWPLEVPLMTIANTGTGASLAHDPMVGLGVTADDVNLGILYYMEKADNMTRWSTPDQVYGSGTGGMYPSLAFDPTFHEPAIAYFVCSLSIGAVENACQPTQQGIQIAQRVMGTWQVDTVTSEHGNQLRLGFLPSGKRVLVFRDYNSGIVKIAVEN